MTRYRARHLIGAVACITAVVYLTLAAVAAGCLFMHAEGHEHHAHDATHSPLCAWSCQATSSTALISDPYQLTVWNVVSVTILHPVPLHADAAAELLQCRAPPRLLAS
ncbi:hypothetical protein ACO9S2_09840 [Nitrospira sp. NS4]|uniref:hypothetical protein n=1 Tax=Nitrospira sp. NS4 TaxID=3414498 RepID=UPI003C2BA2E5